LKTKGIATRARQIFGSAGVRVAVFDLKELRCYQYLKDIYLLMLYLIRHRSSGLVAGKLWTECPAQFHGDDFRVRNQTTFVRIEHHFLPTTVPNYE